MAKTRGEAYSLMVDVLNWLFHLECIVFSHMLRDVGVPIYVFYFIVPILIILSYIEKLISMCKENAVGEKIQHAGRCIETYKAFESGFGPFLCFVFGVTQLLLIFSFFMTISTALQRDSTQLRNNQYHNMVPCPKEFIVHEDLLMY